MTFDISTHNAAVNTQPEGKENSQYFLKNLNLESERVKKVKQK
jgi:hypothetical protein